MALVRAICRSDLSDLTIVTYGGPDVGLLCATRKVSRVIAGFVTLDSIPLDPHWRSTRQRGTVRLTELDEGMLFLALQAAAWRVPFLPSRAGLGSDVMVNSPELRTIGSPYRRDPFQDSTSDSTDPADREDEEFVAVPAIKLDAAIVHSNRADTVGNAQFLGPDPYFDDLFLAAAELGIVSTEKIVGEGELGLEGPLDRVCATRLTSDAVVETPGGAHFTECLPDYGRDESFQREYATSAKSVELFDAFRTRFIDVTEDVYQRLTRPKLGRDV